ncbi:MAG: DUF4328 domain-containing protein [Gammaproteobacteria bacterium]|nr:DUF4328 domain-containing protein [Gammaproteobacteria bacterium]
MEHASRAPEPTKGFSDPTRLTNWTRGFLYASIAAALLGMWSSARALPGGRGEAELDTGLRVILWVFTGLPVPLITAILVLTWIHRANDNTRQLGATDMHFTPGWAIGWYFVPIAWFWKPYQAMTEIWRASRNPSDWRGEPVPPLLRWWWVLWIVPFWGVSIVDVAARGRVDEAGLERLEATTGLVSWMLDIPLALVLLAIIGAVHRMQMDHHRRQLAAG